jgi:hypothetical protein
MGFQIKDKEGNPISINVLDEEAAEFWGRPVDPKHYVSPIKEFTNPDNLEGDALAKAEFKHELDELRKTNWFDKIGWAIHTQDNYYSGWRNLVHTLYVNSIPSIFTQDPGNGSVWTIDVPHMEDLTDEFVDEFKLPETVNVELIVTLSVNKPYIELINHWAEKGYTPHKEEES